MNTALTVITSIALRKAPPLYRAAVLGRSEKVKKLIAAGADPNETGVNGMLPLAAAAGRGNIETVIALLEGGADPNGSAPPFRAPALSLAAYAGNEEVVALLLEWGADPSLKDNTGDAPLDYLQNASALLADETVIKIRESLARSGGDRPPAIKKDDCGPPLPRPGG